MRPPYTKEGIRPSFERVVLSNLNGLSVAGHCRPGSSTIISKVFGVAGVSR